MTCCGKKYLLVVYYIPVHWDFSLKKCMYGYTCMKKGNINKFSIRSTANQKERN